MHSDKPAAAKTSKFTWQQVRQLIEQAGVQDDDEIDCIEISWGTTDQIKLRKDKDFGWQIRQSC
ncbi:MAG TPA: hypothetical protein ENJ65_06325 [Candidatus Tenderia electrophaga]|uniref:Uncharacterized protein n=1 Tax=Candidatus Tenderia electrophaga TaxID=1748243 RepID=A0A832N425_9GAMM|nr:hypothetical protein [Candidatus Tenderia electrophaga]